MKRILSLALLIITIFAFTACGNQDVVALVNGEKILRTDFEKQVAITTASEGIDLNRPELVNIKDYLELEILNKVIYNKVLMQEFERRNLEKPVAFVEGEMAKTKEAVGEEEYQNFLKNLGGISEQDFKDFLVDQFSIADVLFQDMTKEITSIDVDLKAYYEENKDSYFQEEAVRARHILLEDEAEAKDLIARINAGEDMATLAQEKSTDKGSGQNGGDLGFFPREAMVAEFSEVAFNLGVGELSQEPVKSQFGYHIIRTEDKREAKQLGFEEIKDDLYNQLLFSAKNDKFLEEGKKLLEEAEIENFLQKEVEEKAAKKAEEEKKAEELEKEEAEEEKTPEEIEEDAPVEAENEEAQAEEEK